MVQSLDSLHVSDGDPVAAEHIPLAVTAGGLVYDDGASQTFDPDGRTTYVEKGRQTRGEWYLDDDGRFCSFWPPTYRACYELQWTVTEGVVVGPRFTERERGSQFSAHYESRSR